MSMPSDETRQEHEPIIYDHPLVKKTTVYRLPPCQAKGGANDYLVFWALSRGEPVDGVDISLDIVTGPGVLVQNVPYRGYTNALGYVRWLHHRKPYRYQIYLYNELIVGNLSIACPWNEYCDPANPDQPGFVPRGWRPVNTPGHYGYYLTFDMK